MPFIPAIVGAALIGGGSAIGSSLIGRSGSNNMVKQQQQIADQQQNIALQEFERTKPAYNEAFNYYQGLLKGGPQLQNAVAPAAQQISAQWDQAYKNILNNAYTRGGALDKALRNVQTGKAMSLASLYGPAQAQGATGLTQLAGMGGGGLSGLSGAASTLASAQNASLAASQQRAQTLTGLGGAITRILTEAGLFGGGGQAQPTPPYIPPAVVPMQGVYPQQIGLGNLV